MHRSFWTEVAAIQHQVTIGSKQLGLQGAGSRFCCTEAMILEKKAICRYTCGLRPWNVLRRCGITSTAKTAVKYDMESDSNATGQYSHCFPHILLKSCRDVNRKSWDSTPVCVSVCNHFITCLCVCSVAQWFMTLCDPMNSRLPGSSFHGILLARRPEWVGIFLLFYSRPSPPPRDRIRISCVSCIGRQILYPCTTWEAFWLLPVSLSNLGRYFNFSVFHENTEK